MFPNIENMAEFVFDNTMSKVEVDSKEVCLRGVFTDEDIVTAELKYGATILYMRLQEENSK